MNPQLLSVWLLRLLMAALLLFGSEILLWTDPPGRTLPDWALLVVGYVTLGTLVLDLAVRYRVRNIYHVMMVIAVYAMCASLLLNPQSTLVDFPRHLMTRAIGAHGLLGLEMFGLFLALTAGHIARYRRLLLGFSLWVGVYWGIWVRWTPSLTDWLMDEVSLTTMFVYAGVVIGVALVLFFAVTRSERRGALSPLDLQLSPAGMGIALMVLLSLFLLRVMQEAINTPAIPAVLGIITAAVVVLWFQRTDKGHMLLDEHIPPRPLSLAWIVAVGIIFFVATIFSYHLPLIEIAGYNQLSLMEFGFAAIGFIWFPLVAVVISTRAIDLQSRLQD